MQEQLITVSPDVMSGTPVFAGTRVPIAYLFEHIEGGETLDDFLDGYPTVTREHAVAVLEAAKSRLLAQAA
jgi:uncharacterized protein (DUF433 family)